MSESLIQVFVYGTLKVGERNYPVCADRVTAFQPAIALGQLYALPLGYPAMTAGTTPIQGFVLSFQDREILPILDQLELHDPEEFQRHAPGLLLDEHQYNRQPIQTVNPGQRKLGIAWAYLMTPQQAQRLGGVLLPEGIWSDEIQQRSLSATGFSATG